MSISKFFDNIQSIYAFVIKLGLLIKLILLIKEYPVMFKFVRMIYNINR